MEISMEIWRIISTTIEIDNGMHTQYQFLYILLHTYVQVIQLHGW